MCSMAAGGIVLKVENLTVESNQAVPILENINIRVQKNKITSLIGESGAGKTMFAKTLAALLPTAVSSRRPLAIEGEVSARLLDQIDQQMEIWNWQNPFWEPVRVDAAQAWTGRHEGRATASFFSGGVDSFHTLLKNRDLERGDGRISHVLCVLGFDLNPDNEGMYRIVAARLEEVAKELEVAFVPLRTNMRELTDPFAGWQYQQMGAGMAAVGLSLGPLLRRVLIPSGDTALVSTIVAPSNPLTDPLWSTDGTEFHHDGCEATRLQRIRRYIAKSDLALRHLRVCFANAAAGAPQAWNCGRCPKCVRTMVLLHVAGALERCSAFEGRGLDLAAVRAVETDPRYSARHLEEALATLEREGREPELQDALREALRPSRRLGKRIEVFWKLELLRPLRRAWRRLTKSSAGSYR